MINAILDEGRRAGVPVELAVAKDNPDAERLYTRLGFQSIGGDDKDYRMCHSALGRRQRDGPTFR